MRIFRAFASGLGDPRCSTRHTRRLATLRRLGSLQKRNRLCCTRDWHSRALPSRQPRATDGKLGTVSDFLFDDTTWKLRWLVIQTGTWLSDRKVLLHPSAINKADLPNQKLLVKLSREQVEKSPSIAADEPVSMQMEYRLNRYYGMPPLQGGM